MIELNKIYNEDCIIGLKMNFIGFEKELDYIDIFEQRKNHLNQ